MAVYHLYMDESGSPRARLPVEGEYPYFALGGILVKDEDKDVVKAAVEAFKARWGITYALHSVEIRACGEKFLWMRNLSKAERDRFLSDLADTLHGLPVIVHACVIDRVGYINAYHPTYGKGTWELSKSAFSMLVERAAKFADREGRTLHVTFEASEDATNKRIKRHYKSLQDVGAPFDPQRSGKYGPLAPQDMNRILGPIRDRPKRNTMLQVADLLLYPVVIAKEKPDYRPYRRLREAGQLIDDHLPLDEVANMGVKYFRCERLFAIA